MRKIVLYKTPTCPMCQVLIQELNKKNIDFTIVDDVEQLEEKEITFVPVLEINGERLNFKQALTWAREEA